MPVAAERGEQVLTAVKKRRWGTAAAALESYLRVREELGIEDIVRIEDAHGRGVLGGSRLVTRRTTAP